MDIKKVALNDFTLTSLPLVMTRGDLRCWGSGFLYFHNNSHHLVTAWHNCSGRNFVDKQPISKDGWVPSHMQIILPLVHPLEAHDGSEYGTFGFTTRLYFDSEEEQPIWLVDAEQGSRLDIAVLPLSRFNEHPELVGEADREDLVHLVQALIGHTAPQHISVVGRPTCFVAHKRPEFDARLEVADDVYAIGFPQAIAAGHGTAIWKRGSVASEPDLELQRRSAFLIDSATRPGLSGAPVVARFKNPSFDNAGRGRLTLLGERLGFCGLYSSRLGKDVEGAQLGVVWKVEAIERVITSGIAGRSSKDFGGLLTEGAGDSIV